MKAGRFVAAQSIAAINDDIPYTQLMVHSDRASNSHRVPKASPQ
jgi:hypothetical protein